MNRTFLDTRTDGPAVVIVLHTDDQAPYTHARRVECTLQLWRYYLMITLYSDAYGYDIRQCASKGTEGMIGAGVSFVIQFHFKSDVLAVSLK